MIKSEEVFITNSFRETQGLGEEFVERISGQGRALSEERSLVIALYGDLGSGKTTFVQGLAKGLGIKRRIISPTFIIVRSYKLGVRSFFHIDLYRIADEKDIEGLGLEEIMEDPQNIVAIEWAEKMGNLLQKERWNVRFEYLSKEKRRITIEKLEARNPKSLPADATHQAFQAGETIPKSK